MPIKLKWNKLRSNQAYILVEDIQGYQMIYNNVRGIERKKSKKLIFRFPGIL